MVRAVIQTNNVLMLKNLTEAAMCAAADQPVQTGMWAWQIAGSLHTPKIDPGKAQTLALNPIIREGVPVANDNLVMLPS